MVECNRANEYVCEHQVKNIYFLVYNIICKLYKNVHNKKSIKLLILNCYMLWGKKNAKKIKRNKIKKNNKKKKIFFPHIDRGDVWDEELHIYKVLYKKTIIGNAIILYYLSYEYGKCAWALLLIFVWINT